MARRKNTKFIDPRYFMDEKTEVLNEGVDPGDQPAGGADSLAQKKANCKGKWMEHGMEGFDGPRGWHGYCDEKKLDEATRADYYECLEKVPQMYSANSREFGKCLDNPSAYRPPESKRRTLDDIPDIGVSRTGGPRPKGHPFHDYNPRDYDE